MMKVLQHQDCEKMDFGQLVEMKEALFSKIAERGTPKQVLLELYNVLDALQVKRIERWHELPIESLA